MSDAGTKFKHDDELFLTTLKYDQTRHNYSLRMSKQNYPCKWDKMFPYIRLSISSRNEG